MGRTTLSIDQHFHPMFINQKIHILGEFWRSCQSDLQIGNAASRPSYDNYPDILLISRYNKQVFWGPGFCRICWSRWVTVGPCRHFPRSSLANKHKALVEQTSSNNQPQSAYTDIFYANVDFRSDATTQTWHFENQTAFEPVDRWQREALHRQIHYFRGRADRSQYV